MSTHYSQNTAFFGAVALSVWLDIHQGYSFVPMAYSRNLGWFASLVTIGINVFVINSGVDSPNRLHRLLFPYEDLNRPGESTEQWFKTDRTWTHAWIFTIPACAVAWGVGEGPSVLFFYLLGYAMHCVVDGFSKKGVPILVPWQRVSILPLSEGTY